MIKKIQGQREKIAVYLQFFVFYLVTFGVMLNRHYSPDSFNYYSHSATHYQGHLLTARVGAYVAAYLFKDINIIKYQIYFVMLLIVVLSACAAMIYNHYIRWMQEDSRHRALLKIAIAIMFGNVYMTDLFHFPEALPPMACGILFMTIAVLQVEPGMSVKKMMLMLLFATISLNCYQVTLGFFVFFALANIFIIYEGNLTTNAFWDSIKALFCGGAAGLSNIILLRVLQSTGVIALESRTASVGLDGVLKNAKQIVNEACRLFQDPWRFLPKYVLLTVLLLLFALMFAALWKRKLPWQNCLYIVLVIIACRSTLFLPHLLASAVWMAPRSIVSYWSLIAIPCVVLAVHASNERIKDLTLIIMSIFVVIQILSIQKIGVNIISNNRLDQEISYMIQDRIEEYEKESGKQIETILFRNDYSPVHVYHSIDFAAFEMALREYTVSWGCVEMINYFNEEHYGLGIMDDEAFFKYFVKQNWDCLNLEEQLVFDGNTAYYVVY